ncbi:hypothetical protein Ancab_009902 [Ancistrocladus abbreviatus]
MKSIISVEEFRINLNIEANSKSLCLYCCRSYVAGATNLMHYLALKCLDMEQLKQDLFSIGLLNLETIKPCVLPSLAECIQMSENLLCLSSDGTDDIVGIPFRRRLNEKKIENTSTNNMKELALSNRDLLLGSLLNGRTTHIMVTVGQEAVESRVISDILKAGAPLSGSIVLMGILQCGMLEKPCRILMDLAGPKLHTDKLKDGPRVMEVSPKKNATGNMIFPAQLWLSYMGSGLPPAHLHYNAVIDVSSWSVAKLLTFSLGSNCMSGQRRSLVGVIVDVPPVEQFVRVRVGDLLIAMAQPTKINCLYQQLSTIRFEGLTSKDLMDLDFVASHADMVGFSFVHNVHDVALLCKELQKQKVQNLGIMLKIETKGAFENLPDMLLEAMKSSNPLGILIAREGAAHIPVIWATQAKTRAPTRAEITNVATGNR